MLIISFFSLVKAQKQNSIMLLSKVKSSLFVMLKLEVVDTSSPSFQKQDFK
jgi:hypothetical protein